MWLAGSRIAYFYPLGFEELVDPRHSEGGVGADAEARELAAIALHDWDEYVLPAVGAVHARVKVLFNSHF